MISTPYALIARPVRLGRRFLSVACILLPLLFAGCASSSLYRVPKADFSKVKKVFVENRLGDDHALDEIVVRTLQSLGYEASSGPLTLKPDNLDAIVFYDDRWAWDFKRYLIAFSVTVRDARRGTLMGTSEYYRPSPFSKAPEAMIRDVVTPLFRPTPK